ncbi:MAG: hypothetical protein E7J27_11715, partial [Haemophilus parainfluenzae]|nr:hypothetical protein [Haemophilus parainfluenzae]
CKFSQKLIACFDFFAQHLSQYKPSKIIESKSEPSLEALGNNRSLIIKYILEVSGCSIKWVLVK